MNITVGVFADEIIAELGYNSADKKIDRRNVIVRMDIEYRNAIMAMIYGGMYSNGMWQIGLHSVPIEPPDVFYKSRKATIALDCDRQQYYTTMPSDYVNFQNNNCIRRVCTAKDQNDVFINQMAGSVSAFGLLESAALAGQKGYEMEGNTMWFNNMPSGAYEGKDVLITYIPAVGGMAETDMLPLSGEMSVSFARAVREAFGLQLQVPEDKTVDSVSNP